jgi:uncharacterized membrane protein
MMGHRGFYGLTQWLAALVVLVGLERWVGGASWGYSVALGLVIVAVGAMASYARRIRREEKSKENS